MIKTEDKHCYTPVKEEGQRGIYRVAKVTWNQGGYQPLGKADPNDPHEMDKFVFKNKDQVRSVVDNMNDHLGVNKDRERQIKVSTMF